MHRLAWRSMRPLRPSAILRAARVSALLVTDLVNIKYLTGLSVSSGALVVEPRHMTFFTDARYLEAAKRDCYPHITVADLADLLPRVESLRRCGFENTVTVERLGRWERKYQNTRFVRTSGIIEEFRRSKDAGELRFFRRAQRITREMIRRVPSLLKRPISERDLAWQLRLWARELGADELSFDPIVGFGTHTSSPHHHPTDRVLKRGHIVQIDVGAKFHGYCADQSAVFFTGKPTPLQRDVLKAVIEAKDAAIAVVHPGVTTHALDSIARKVLKAYGFDQYFTHSLGHGVGLEIHEGPTLSKKAPVKKLLAGEIVTIEPGVYFPGKFGMRVEEEVIVV